MRIWLLACFAASLLVFGCGGSDNGGNTGGGNADVKVFATDDPVADYQSVWVTIKRIDLVGSSGTVTAYDSSTGNVIDLTTLNDNGTSQFELLGIANIPTGTYSAVKVTMDQNLTLVPKNNGTPVSATFAGSNNGTATFSFDLNDHLANQDNLVIDFDLNQWQVVNSVVTPVIKKGLEDGLSDSQRMERSEFEGVVANLAGDGTNLTFDLQSGFGTLKVSTSDATDIFRHTGKPNPTLANGTRVHVRGTFDVAANAILADEVMIQNESGGMHEDEAFGIVGTVDATNHTFELSLTEADHFMPNTDTITVATSEATTVFFDRGGVSMTQEEFYTWLATNTGAATALVEVQGTYDPNTKVFTATQVKLEESGNHEGDHMADVKGSASNIDTTAHTFSLTIKEFEGAIFHVGDVVTITVDQNTKFYSHGQTLTVDEFFGQIANNATVQIDGTVSGTTILATSVRLMGSMGM